MLELYAFISLTTFNILDRKVEIVQNYLMIAVFSQIECMATSFNIWYITLRKM